MQELDLKPSSRIASIGVSEILKITGAANARKRAGNPTIILGAGEPDFDTPDFIKEAAAKAMREGDTKYTAIDGTAELKKAIQEKFKRDNNLEYNLDQITVSSGAKQILFNAFMASLNNGDEVIIPAPYWTSYSDIVTICGGKPQIVQCLEEENFCLSAEKLEAAINSKTRWLLLNSPSNPSGAAYTNEQLKAIGDVLLKYPDIWIISDDIYEHILYDNRKFTNILDVIPELKKRTLLCNGVSKAYAMTGWRLGYGAGPSSLIKAMSVVQSQSTSCPSSISQAAAVAALNGPQDIVKQRCVSFQKRRDLIVDGLNTIPSINCRRPEGAFYVFANCSKLLGKITPEKQLLKSDIDFCNYLMRSVDVAVVPGTYFGLAPFFRISYATNDHELNESIKRIKIACDELV